MSSSAFIIAYELTAQSEGGWVNDPADEGRETYAGISRRYNPKWEGWAIIDKIPNKRRHAKFPDLSEKVIAFYRANYWDKFNIDEIKDVKLACNVYDFCVNSGDDGIKCLQKVVGAKADGVLGPLSIAMINNYKDPWALNALYNVERVRHYTDVAIKDIDNRKFIVGWIARVARHA